MKNVLYSLFLLLSLSISAQEIVSVEAQEVSPAFLLNLVLPINVDYDVQNYKVIYTTVDAFGQPDTASGLLCVPLDRELVFPLAVYNHGTVASRDGVPSVVGVAERLLPQGIAASGYITVAPDYIGLGESDGFHPYVHADTEASAGRDLLLAVRGWLDAENIRYNEQLFLTGYSQGGHATAALHRDLQENPGNDGLTVTAASFLSGPYSISGIMRETIFQEGRATLPGYIVYTYISYSTVYDLYDDYAEIFVDPYLTVVDSFFNEELTLGAFNARLDTLLSTNDQRLIDMFQDSIQEVLTVADPSHPIIQALRDNDTYDWAPEAPTLIYYCTEDEQVPFANALLADSVMRANGSTSIVLESGGPRTHGDCVLPAATRTLNFFADFARVNSVSTGQPVYRPDISLRPNPVRAGQPLRIEGLPAGTHDYGVYDQSGRLLLRGVTAAEGSLPMPANLPRGLVILRVGLSDGTSVIRLVLVE